MRKVLVFGLLSLLIFVLAFNKGAATFYFGDENTMSDSFHVGIDNIKENYTLNSDGNLDSDYYRLIFFPQPRYASAGIACTADLTYDSDIRLKNFNNHNEKYQQSMNDILNYQVTKDPDHFPNGSVISSDTNNYFYDNYYVENKNYRYRYVSGRGFLADGYWEDTALKNNNLYDDAIFDDLFKPREVVVYKNLSFEDFEYIGTPTTIMLDNGYVSSDRYDHRGYSLKFSGWTTDKNAAIDKGYGGQIDFSLLSTLDNLKELDSTNADGSLANDKVIFVYPIFSAGKDYGYFEAYDRNAAISINKASNKTYMARTKNDNGGGHYFTNLNVEKLEDVNIHVYPCRDSDLGWEGDGDKFSVAKAKVYHNNDLENFEEIPAIGNYNLIDSPGNYRIYAYINTDAKCADDHGNYNQELPDNYVPEFLQKHKLDKVIRVQNIYVDKNWFFSNEVQIWIYVERLTEFKLVGGPSDSNDYLASNNRLYVLNNETSDKRNNIYHYEIKNVYFDDVDSFYDRGFSKKAFGIRNDQNKAFKLKIDNYFTNNTDSKYQNTKNLLTTSNDTLLKDKFLLVNEAGYYDFYLRVFVNKKTNQVSDIKVSAALSAFSSEAYFVFEDVYQDGDFISPLDDGGEYESYIELKYFQNIMKNRYGQTKHYYHLSLDNSVILDGDVVVVRDDGKLFKLSELVTNGYELFMHQTRRVVPLDRTFVLTKNTIFYIRKTMI